MPMKPFWSHSFFLVVVFMLSTVSYAAVTPASAGLVMASEGGDLYLSCRSDNDCVLTPTPVGEEKVSEQSFANTFQTEQVTFEFDADPGQDHIAVLPELLGEFELDFRHQTEAGALFRPAMEVRLILGQNVNVWSFDQTLLPSNTYEPYTLSDESLSQSSGRVMWLDDPIRLIITATIDRPGTWELNMRGASFLKMDIPWSIDPQNANSDEPSSRTQPVSTLFEDVHAGALVGDDYDCWSFEIETHEVLRLMIEWQNVPLELEQPHPVPDLITSAGRLSPQPDVIVEDDGDSVKMTYRWRALPTGDYSLCLHGSIDKFQSYTWSGVFGYESLGPTDPSGFASESYYPHGVALLGDVDRPYVLHEQGLALLILAVIMFGVFLFVAARPTTSYGLRFGLFVPGVIMLLIGGILHPIFAMADEAQYDNEITLDDLIEMRLQQLWDVSSPGVPDQTLLTHTGSTWGMLPGETLKMRLSIEKAIPLDDGRWQLIVPELEDLRLDQVIFSQVAVGQTQGTNTGMLEDQTIRFILLAGRSLLLDLLMLEALLVVDELPQSSVFHINAEMVSTQSTGSVNAPAWATRPASIDENDWVLLQGSLFPERISISLCDCDLDLLDVTFLASNGFDSGDLVGEWDLKNAEGLTPYGPLLMWLGLILGIVATSFEVRRFTQAQRLAESFARQSGKWN